MVNASRVIPARLRGVRENGREAEVLLVHSERDGSWLAMVHPGGKLKVGRKVTFGSDGAVEVVEVLRGGLRRLRLYGKLDASALMEQYGTVPLPPYIERPADEQDKERYQTIFAREAGSVAAPTAGLHFTPEVIERVGERGASIVEIVLHVGPGTFKPVEVDDPARHVMHAEWYSVPGETARAINEARSRDGRVWAVGTTTARTLETVGAGGELIAGSGWTDLFLYPPHNFATVDALLTNFHRPRSTLLMLVAAFAGYDYTMSAYSEAVARKYRLFSYGDAMAIL